MITVTIHFPSKRKQMYILMLSKVWKYRQAVLGDTKPRENVSTSVRDYLRMSSGSDTRSSSDGAERQKHRAGIALWVTEPFMGRKASGGRTQRARTVLVCKDVVPTQTVERGGFEATAKNTAFTVCGAKPQTLHTKQSPELVQQLSWERGANGTHALTHSVSCAVW